nr:immunoglobulin light chain junction region [Macaca mulatta]MOW09495.1 immunoglobulin light chain junction region [Macaca mulatta]MOW10032.1 immunoglobulin light chain junction region [Macaca mulatta]MOW10039.1 immunoglobulin light chain junction region [Macaca mulatta]MOW10100.1 immunoglobulin light chain junction region [Macaca mulatta]
CQHSYGTAPWTF